MTEVIARPRQENRRVSYAKRRSFGEKNVLSKFSLTMIMLF
jgi:hypothetical protein